MIFSARVVSFLPFLAVDQGCGLLGQRCGWIPSRHDVLSPVQALLVDAALEKVLSEIRPDAVAIVDAFDFSDRVLGSDIGRYDGNVYEALYLSATRSHLNQEQPFRGYHEYLRPELDLDFLRAGNSAPTDAHL